MDYPTPKIVVTFLSKSPETGPSEPNLKSILDIKKRDNRILLSLDIVGLSGFFPCMQINKRLPAPFVLYKVYLVVLQHL